MITAGSPLRVELRNSAGPIFCGQVEGVEFRSKLGAVVEIGSNSPEYLSLGKTSEVSFRICHKDRKFRLANAFASLDGVRLVILAESIEEMG
jgi:hypothetical protein